MFTPQHGSRHLPQRFVTQRCSIVVFVALASLSVAACSKPASEQQYDPAAAREEARMRKAATELGYDLLVKHTQIPAAHMETESIEAAEWPDAGLGCPQQGSAHPRDKTAGYRLHIKAGGKLYAVHVAPPNGIVCGPVQ